MIKEIKAYAEGLNANPEVLSWIDTTGTKAVKIRGATLADMEHVLDFLCSSAAPKRLQKMSYVDAKRKAEDWSKANQKKGRNLIDSEKDIVTLHEFENGRIVELKTKAALQREGFLMNHCVGAYNLRGNCQIYSYRDNNNQPHATFEVRKQNNEIVQIKGKGNGPIHPKYINPILEFLSSINMNIRPHDMINLGYHHIHKEHLDFLRKTCANTQIVMIRGEAYAF